MAAPRAHVREIITSRQSNGTLVPIPSAQVSIYSAGTTTNITQTMYTTSGGSGTYTNPLTADSNGQIEFWIPTEQTVDLAITATGYSPYTVTVEALVSTGSGVKNIGTSALTNNGDLLVTGSVLEFKDTAAATHTVATLDAAQTFTGGMVVSPLPLTAGTAYFTTISSATFTGAQTFSGGVAITTLPVTVTSAAAFSGGANVTTLPITIATAYVTTVAGNVTFTGLETNSGGVVINTLPATIGTAYITTVAGGVTFTGAETLSGGVAITTLPITVSSKANFSGGMSVSVLPFTVNGPAYLGMTASGNILYGGTGGVATALPIGSSTQVLTVSGGLPSWSSVAASNPFKELQTASSTTQRTSTSTASPGSNMTDYSVSVTPDGTHPVYIDVFVPEVFQSASAIYHIAIIKDAAVANTSSFNAFTGPGICHYRDPAPTNALHTYTVAVWSNSTQTVTFLAASGTEVGYITATQVGT